MVSQRYDNLVTSNTGSKIVAMVNCTFPPRIIGGPLQPGVEPTATGSVEIQLVDQGGNYDTKTKFYSLTFHVVLHNIQTCNNFFKTQQKTDRIS